MAYAHCQHGNLDRQPHRIRLAWLSCDAGGEKCAATSGATSQGYKLRLLDVGFRLKVHVTAKNASGSASALSVPTAVVPAMEFRAGVGGAGLACR